MLLPVFRRLNQTIFLLLALHISKTIAFVCLFFVCLFVCCTFISVELALCVYSFVCCCRRRY